MHGHFWATNEALWGATALTLTLTLTDITCPLKSESPNDFSPRPKRASFRPWGFTPLVMAARARPCPSSDQVVDGR